MLGGAPVCQLSARQAEHGTLAGATILLKLDMMRTALVPGCIRRLHLGHETAMGYRAGAGAAEPAE